MATWSLHGVLIDADIEIGRRADPAADPDIRFRLDEPRPVGRDRPPGVVLLERTVEDQPFQTAARDGSRTVLRIHGLCDFRLTEGTNGVDCIPDPGLTPDQLVLLVRGAFLAFYLGLRRECVLHASAVDAAGDGSALVFVGRAGWGKSTIAAWLCTVGARLIVDDLLRLEGSCPPRWIGTSAELRLRPGATSLIDAAPPTWTTRPTVDGRTAVVPQLTGHEEGPVSAVVLPARNAGASALAVTVLDPVDALLELLRFPRLEGWKAGDVIESQFDALSRLVGSVPVYRASVPWGPPFSRRTALDLLRSIGAPNPAVSCSR